MRARHSEREVVRLSVGPKAIDRGGGDVHEVDGPLIERELPRLEPGEVEKVTDQAFEPARLSEDHLARGRRVARRAVGDRLCVAADRGERRAQVVRDGQQELLLEALRTFERARHRVDRAGEVGDLVVPLGHRHACAQVARSDPLRGDVRLSQWLCQPLAQSGGDQRAEQDRGRRREQEPAHGGPEVEARALREHQHRRAPPCVDDRGRCVHERSVVAAHDEAGFVSQSSEVEIGGRHASRRCIGRVAAGAEHHQRGSLEAQGAPEGAEHRLLPRGCEHGTGVVACRRRELAEPVRHVGHLPAQVALGRTARLERREGERHEAREDERDDDGADDREREAALQRRSISRAGTRRPTLSPAAARHRASCAAGERARRQCARRRTSRGPTRCRAAAGVRARALRSRP